MNDKSNEYDSLRQEILQHQSRRDAILTLIIPVITAIFYLSLQLQKPYLIPLALFLLYIARVQITQIQAGSQRISSYIRVVIEQKQPEFRWETGSYLIRSASVERNKAIGHISSIAHIGQVLLLLSIASIFLAAMLTWLLQDPTEKPLAAIYGIGLGIVWARLWHRYNTRVDELERLELEDSEAKFWDWLHNTPEFQQPETTKIENLRPQATIKYREYIELDSERERPESVSNTVEKIEPEEIEQHKKVAQTMGRKT